MGQVYIMVFKEQLWCIIEEKIRILKDYDKE